MPALARGIRNNNPGNIRLGPRPWQGQVPPERQTDKEYVQFERPEDGIRAIARVLLTYRRRGFLSIRDMVSRWAPPNENLTEPYIRVVAAAAELDPELDLTSATFERALPRIVAAIIRQENGSNPYDGATIAHAVSLA